MEFLPYKNSLLYELTSPNTFDETDEPERKKSKLPDYANKNLSLISGLYIYTNTPPHGYGTQAPKVAETINRAYNFNIKKLGKEVTILGRKIERMHWERSDGSFPFDQIHGNFIPSEGRRMVESFLKTNQPYVDGCSDEVMKRILETNSDVLTKGKQTFCPFSGQSSTSAVAYKRMYEFLSKNSGNKCLSCLEWIQAFMSLLEKNTIEYETAAWETVNRTIYDKATKQRRVVKRKVKRLRTLQTSSKEETRELLIMIATRFASYIKHKERGKKDRRAIASANMILRMFLHIIEEFHLKLSERIEGATISIGGEEKKQKIASNMSTATLPSGPAAAVCQGTEDATKWNECLSPSLFALMHKYLFDKKTRIKLGLPQPTEMGTLFSMIAVAGNFLMSMKEIQIGKGLMVYNDSEYNRMEWSREWVKGMNDDTKHWFEESEKRITDDGEFFRASPGMLMGMMNAGSTTLGLLATNHRMKHFEMKVLTLRSSDDSMSLYMGNNPEGNRKCVEMNRRNLGMLGINISPDKTFFFREGLGEYTSWYMDKKFISQFGTETASIKPKGINPHDDFHSVAKETSTALATLTINHLGASVRLRIGIDGVRRIWRIKRNPGKRPNISDKVLLLSDGGRQKWTSTNCHLEETAVSSHYAMADQEKEYLLRIRNPDNPFSSEPSDEMVYSKEFGTLILDRVEIPRTCFNFLKKSNRTLDREDKKEEAESEQNHHAATKIINLIDPTTLVSSPSTNSTISSHLSAILKTEIERVTLDENERRVVLDAIKVLDFGDYSLLEEEEQHFVQEEADDLWGEEEDF